MSASGTTIVPAIAGAGVEDAAGKFVVIDGATQKVTVAGGPTEQAVFGILLAGAVEDADVHVVVSGPTSAAFAGGALQHGDYVTSDATGRPVLAATGNLIYGQYQASEEVDGYPTVAAGDQVFDIFVAPVKQIAAL